MTPNIEAFHISCMTKGSKTSFNELYIYYHPMVYRFLVSLLKSDLDAQDIAQDIFYKLWFNREKLTHITYLKPYIYKMAKNAVYERYRHSLVDIEFQNLTLNETSITDIPEKELYAKEIEELIELALTQIPKQRQIIFKLSRKDGLSNQEIAERLNISKRTVENSISLTLTELRKIIKIAIILFIC